ncbi:MAG TPA: hypothetical protein VKU01_06765 [Bryobacteraceae bacterium]|nr:hypothetical protein [Bryobacteraceae bacterium]
MDPLLDEYFRLLGIYAAAQGAAQEQAWKNLILFLAKNPGAYRAAYAYLSKEGTVAVEEMIARIAVAQGAKRAAGKIAARLTIRAYIARLTASFAVSPKIPIPQAQAALTLAIALTTLAPAIAEGREAQEKYHQWEAYQIRYIDMMAKRLSLATTYTPVIPPPLQFEEWVAANR